MLVSITFQIIKRHFRIDVLVLQGTILSDRKIQINFYIKNYTKIYIGETQTFPMVIHLQVSACILEVFIFTV